MPAARAACVTQPVESRAARKSRCRSGVQRARGAGESGGGEGGCGSIRQDRPEEILHWKRRGGVARILNRVPTGRTINRYVRMPGHIPAPRLVESGRAVFGCEPLTPTVMPAKAGISGEGTQKWSMARGGYTYIMPNKARGVLYIGVAADLARIEQHRNGSGSAFCRRYGLMRLVLVEAHDDILLAIAREKALKAWKREWKIRLIEESNPDRHDIADLIF